MPLALAADRSRCPLTFFPLRSNPQPTSSNPPNPQTPQTLKNPTHPKPTKQPKQQNVALFLLDEAHLLGGAKGPVMEVAASRMRYIAAQTDSKIRIVALSHSLANARDVGEWLGAGPHALFNFPPGVRPVPLEVHVQGLDILNFEARMQARRFGF